VAASPAAELVELRVLDGPNLYFPRPAIKLVIRVAGWQRASPASIERAGRALGVRAAEQPGAPGSQHRQRVIAKLGAAGVDRELADPLALGARAGNEVDALQSAARFGDRGRDPAKGLVARVELDAPGD